MLKLLLAYSPIILGFYCAFAILFNDAEEMMNFIYRIGEILSMSMGEVNTGILENPGNSTNQFYEAEFWDEVHFSGHLVYTVFCLTVPMLILNILTAFAIKVCVSQLSVSQSAVMVSCQDVEKVLRDAEINKLKTQADYISIVEQSFLSK